MQTEKCSLFILKLVSAIRIELWWHKPFYKKKTKNQTILNVATRWFHSLVVSLVHTGDPATFASAQESQVSLYKG